MARSSGIKVIAVLLVLGGIFGGYTNVSLLVGASDEQVRAQVELQLGQLKVGTGPGQVPPERVEEIRGWFLRLIEEWHGLLRLPSVQTAFVLSSLLDLAAIVGGIGLFMMARWAWAVSAWQAGLSIAFAIWANVPLAAALRRLGDVIAGIVGGLSGSSGEVQSVVGMVETTLLWTNALCAISWNGFVLWWLTRASVRAHFQETKSA